MSINLVSLVTQYLTPALIGRIAAALGVDRTLVGKAATYLAPVLLRMLAGVASTPAGAQRLADTVEHQDPSILENLELRDRRNGSALNCKRGRHCARVFVGWLGGVRTRRRTEQAHRTGRRGSVIIDRNPDPGGAGHAWQGAGHRGAGCIGSVAASAGAEGKYFRGPSSRIGRPPQQSGCPGIHRRRASQRG